MANRKKIEEKNKPGINFTIPVSLNFPISAPIPLQTKFKEVMNTRGLNISKFFRRNFLKTLEVETPEEIFIKYPIVRKKKTSLKREISDEAAFDNDMEFSEWGRKLMIDKIQEVENEKNK